MLSGGGCRPIEPRLPLELQLAREFELLDRMANDDDNAEDYGVPPRG